MKRLSSRERVRRAFRHEALDRVPIDYMANAGIDSRLKEHFQIAAQDHEYLLQALHVDFREITVPYTGPELHTQLPNRKVDSQWGIVTRWAEHETGGYWDFCDFPLQGLDPERIEAWPMPSPDDYDYAAVQDQLKNWPELALYVGNPGLGDILNTTGMLCGMEDVYVALALEDPAWLRLVDRRLDIQYRITERILDAAGGRIDFMWLGEDIGGQQGPLISPEQYRKTIKPRHRKFTELAEAYDIPVMIHSCGSSSWAYDDFIDLGIQAVDTLQPDAAHMKPAYLKQKYGDKLAFHGGFSTGTSLTRGGPEDVIRELENLLSIMMPGGGYMFSPTHMLQDNSILEHVLVLYEAVLRLGRY